MVYALFTVQIPLPGLFPDGQFSLIRGLLLVVTALARFGFGDAAVSVSIATSIVVLAGLWSGAAVIYSALVRRVGKAAVTTLR